MDLSDLLLRSLRSGRLPALLLRSLRLCRSQRCREFLVGLTDLLALSDLSIR